MGIDFEALFARSPNPYVVLDPQLTIVWTNQAYLRVTTRAAEELIGRTMFEAFPSDPNSESRRLLSSSFQRVLASGEPDEIALIRYDIARADGTMEERYWSATHTPLLDPEGRIAYILQHTVDVTELHGLRRLRDEMGVVQRANAVQEINRDLAAEAQQLKSLFEQAPGFVAILSEPGHVFQAVNRAYRSLIGGRDVVGLPVARALPEIVDQGFVGLLDRVVATRKAYVGDRDRIGLRNESGDTVERFLDFIYQPILDSGQVSGIFVQGHDVTEQVEAEERQKLLIDELNHRVKNTLAIVQALAMQSFKSVEGAETARATFDARLNTLAAAHSILTQRNWESAYLLDTIRGGVEATAGSAMDRIHLHGPDFLLRPQTSVSLAMMIHELSTNAIKYGALSVPEGQVEVSWTIEDVGEGCQLTITWIESGGPMVVKPTRTGFGTRLINHGMSNEKGARVIMDFRPEGLCCSIVAMLPHVRS